MEIYKERTYRLSAHQRLRFKVRTLVGDYWIVKHLLSNDNCILYMPVALWGIQERLVNIRQGRFGDVRFILHVCQLLPIRWAQQNLVLR